MALTKASEAIDAWEEIAQDNIREGAAADLDPNFEHILHIDHALTSETAHDGTEIIVQISSSDADDEFWSRLTSFVAGTGTAASEVTDDNPLAATATTITISSTTGFEVEGKDLFLEDVDDIVNSEMVYQIEFTSSTDITIIDGVKRSHALNSILNNIAETFVVQIPFGARRARVLYNNSFDSGGSTVATRARLTKVTSIS